MKEGVLREDDYGSRMGGENDFGLGVARELLL